MQLEKAHELIPVVNMFLSITINSLLIWLILYKSPRGIGSYRYLLLTFASFDITYSVVDVVIRPGAHSHGNMWFIFCSGFLSETSYGALAVSIFCSFYGMSLILLAVHFLYRYLSVCEIHGLVFFKGINNFFWAAFALGYSISWALIVYYMVPATPLKREYIRETMWQYYQTDANTLQFIGPLYYIIDAGGLHIQWTDCASVVLMSIFESFSLLTMAFCAFEVMRRLQTIIMSKRSLDLQKQLFRALLVQALIPIVFSYIPSLSAFVSPLIGHAMEKGTNYMMITLSFFPVFDPIAIIYFVKDYRGALIKSSKINNVSRTALSNASVKSIRFTT